MDAMFYSAGLLTALAFFAALAAAGLGGWALRGRQGGQPPPGPRRLLSQAAMETQSIGLALRRIAGTRYSSFLNYQFYVHQTLKNLVL